MGDISHTELRRAAARYNCDLCGETIPAGTLYEYGAGRIDDDFYRWKRHRTCGAVVRAWLRATLRDEEDAPRTLREFVSDIAGAKGAPDPWAAIVAELDGDPDAEEAARIRALCREAT